METWMGWGGVKDKEVRCWQKSQAGQTQKSLIMFPAPTALIAVHSQWVNKSPMYSWCSIWHWQVQHSQPHVLRSSLYFSQPLAYLRIEQIYQVSTTVPLVHDWQACCFSNSSSSVLIRLTIKIITHCCLHVTWGSDWCTNWPTIAWTNAPIDR